MHPYPREKSTTRSAVCKGWSARRASINKQQTTTDNNRQQLEQTTLEHHNFKLNRHWQQTIDVKQPTTDQCAAVSARESYDSVSCCLHATRRSVQGCGRGLGHCDLLQSRRAHSVTASGIGQLEGTGTKRKTSSLPPSESTTGTGTHWSARSQ